MNLIQLKLKVLLDARGNVREECQLRVQTDMATVEEYADDLRAGCVFPPIVVFFDPEVHVYYLAGGFHRVWAHLEVGRATIDADVRRGTRRDAILFAAGDNYKHGWKRSNLDKRKAVMLLLEDPEWQKWSSRQIADICKVSPSTVDDRRAEMTAYKRQSESTERFGKDGRAYTTPPPRPPRAKAKKRIQRIRAADLSPAEERAACRKVALEECVKTIADLSESLASNVGSDAAPALALLEKLSPTLAMLEQSPSNGASQELAAAVKFISNHLILCSAKAEQFTELAEVADAIESILAKLGQA